MSTWIANLLKNAWCLTPVRRHVYFNRSIFFLITGWIHLLTKRWEPDGKTLLFK